MTHSSASSPQPASSSTSVSPAGIPSRACVRNTGWPLERVLFLMAGTITLISAVLGALVSPWVLLLTGFVGLNQLAYATTGVCGASYLLARVGGLRSSLYTEGREAGR